MSPDCCVALPRGVIGLSAFAIVVFPDHPHLLFFVPKNLKLYSFLIIKPMDCCYKAITELFDTFPNTVHIMLNI